jgi:hypothetical protein
MVLHIRHAFVGILVTALVLGPIPASLSAPALTRISGRVFDHDLVTPAADLTVQAIPENAKAPLASGQTDHRGRFRLQGLPADNYILLLSDAAGAPVAAARVETRTASSRIVTLALPETPPEGAAPPAGGSASKPSEKKGTVEKKHRGILAWISTPVGATVALVAGAVVLAAIANQATKDKKDNINEFPITPTSPQ